MADFPELLLPEARQAIIAASRAGELADPAVVQRLSAVVIAGARAGLGERLDPTHTIGSPSGLGSHYTVGGGLAVGKSVGIIPTFRTARTLWSSLRSRLDDATPPEPSPSPTGLGRTLSRATLRALTHVGVLDAPTPEATRGQRLLASGGISTEALACTVILERSGQLADTAAFALLNLADAAGRVVAPAVQHDVGAYLDLLLSVLEPGKGPHHSALVGLSEGGTFTLIHLEAWVLALRRLARANRLPTDTATYGRGPRWWKWIGQTDMKVPTALRRLRNEAAHQRGASEDEYRRLCTELLGTRAVSEWMALATAPALDPRWLDRYLERLDPVPAG